MSLIITVTATPVATMLSPYHSTMTTFCDEMTTGYSPGIKLHAGIIANCRFQRWALRDFCAVAEYSYFYCVVCSDLFMHHALLMSQSLRYPCVQFSVWYRLSWLPVSFLLHVKYPLGLSYRIAVVCSFVALQYVSPGALQCLCSVLIN